MHSRPAYPFVPAVFAFFLLFSFSQALLYWVCLVPSPPHPTCLDPSHHPGTFYSVLLQQGHCWSAENLQTIPSPLHPTRRLLPLSTVAVYLHLTSFYSGEKISGFQNQWRRFCFLPMDEQRFFRYQPIQLNVLD